MRSIIAVIAFGGWFVVPCPGQAAGMPHRLLDNNLRCVDLSDLTSAVPMDASAPVEILRRTEAWEHNTFDSVDADTLGYPSVVKNDRGKNPDNKYYLFYAHHDPCSCIGCAVADAIQGPYRKLAELKASRRDSIVLANPHYPIRNAPVQDPSHYSSPCVVWNEERKLWFMYFHFYNHNHEAWKAAGKGGYGHQMTTLATCPDLRANVWTALTDPQIGKVCVWDLVPVLPTTEADWMNSQSSYHTIQRLADGSWLAFLRGTSVDQVTQLGFAASRNGKTWSFFPQNPVVRSAANGDGKTSVYRPFFVGHLGRDTRGRTEYLVVWGESPPEADVPQVRYGYTTDFVEIRRDPRGYARWKPMGDGPMSAWREADKLYLFSGKHLLVMTLPVPVRSPNRSL